MPKLSVQSAPAGVPHVHRRTRLAPSPTGALHLGNARTFLINWALAKQRGWRIVLRIEDLDTPRVKPGVTDAMLRTLKSLGIDWDEGPIVQSDDLEPYQHAMAKLAGSGRVYPSIESRGEIDTASDAALSAPQEGMRESVFSASRRPGTFPTVFSSEGALANWRFATPEDTVSFADEFAGPQQHSPAKSVGDFVVWTKRNQPSYQLAVVVDDARQGVTHIVRGDDLLDSAARQILLMRALGISEVPNYFHLPLVRGSDGKRLAKRHGDTRVETYLASGVSPERIIALLARWSGIEDAEDEMSSKEFAARFELSRLSPDDVVFTARDDEWLRKPARRKPNS
ncbi:MAG: tRNA glutamyl-Q(34) synthetase GluQRS [Phycisphaeraceae bacterium]|nr:tRNA glutamyl-Q(34) synthetase GluQRS [Phycisphaeraceae bacterium]